MTFCTAVPQYFKIAMAHLMKFELIFGFLARDR